MSVIFHITRPADWQTAQTTKHYHTASLATEGFIHCSTQAQVVDTANRYYRGQTGLILLCIETERVASPIKFEPPSHPESGVTNLFPHIYGPLNTDAVVRVAVFPPEADGSFRLPTEIGAQTNCLNTPCQHWRREAGSLPPRPAGMSLMAAAAK
jgi:uncharacterized protein (DUF952 family)